MEQLEDFVTGERFSDWLNVQFSATIGVTAKDVAELANISPGYLSGLRKSIKDNPSPKVAEQIAVAFASTRGLSESQTRVLIEEACRAAEVSGHSATSRIASDGGVGYGRWGNLSKSILRTMR